MCGCTNKKIEKRTPLSISIVVFFLIKVTLIDCSESHLSWHRWRKYIGIQEQTPSVLVQGMKAAVLLSS